MIRGRTRRNQLEMAKKYGITLQHTKVVVNKNGQVSSKSLEGFTQEKVLEVTKQSLDHNGEHNEPQ